MVLWACLCTNAQRQGADSLSQQATALSYDTFFLEAMVQRQKSNHDAAFDLLRHCIRINPKSAEAYYFLAQYYQLLKNDSVAQQCYLKAAELEPDNSTFLEPVVHQPERIPQGHYCR